MSITLENLTLTYQQRSAVHEITAEINDGEWLAIVGPNGAGKSTLLNALAGLAQIRFGSIKGICREKIAYLPQRARLDSSFPITVSELVGTGLLPKLGFSKALRRAHFDACEYALEAVGLQDCGHRLIGTLSGGQLQRCLFARILLEDQPVILLDEPFTAMDVKTVIDLTRLIEQWHREARTVIMVTHDIDYVRQQCSCALLLARTCIGYGKPHEVLTTANMRRARQMALSLEPSSEGYAQRAI